MKNLKHFEEHTIKKLSDVLSSGNLSAEYQLKKDKNMSPYIKKDGEYIKVDQKQSIPKNAVYLTDKQVDEYNNIAKEIKKLQDKQDIIFNNKNNENFDPMLSAENLLNEPLLLILITSWILKGKYKFDNIKYNIIEMKNDFLDYCNMMGYAIDKNIVDYKFKILVDNVKNTLKIKK